jgi:hypothetical protein
MAMLKREGRFRLLKSKLSKDIRIWHNCVHYGDKELEKNKTIYEVQYGGWYSKGGGLAEDEEGRWMCSMCGDPSPDGLTGAYIMLDWDRATNEVADWEPYDGVSWKSWDIPF